MGYSTLIIDLEELKDIESGLKFVHEEMSNIKEITGYVNTLIGDPEPDLKGAVNNFESSWDDNRKGIVEAAEKMRQAVEKVINDWTEWDTKTAKELSPENQPGPENPNGAH